MMKPHQRIFGIFFIFALSMGALFTRLPDLQVRLGLTEGQLGLLLLTMSVGALIGLTACPTDPVDPIDPPAPPPANATASEGPDQLVSRELADVKSHGG